MQMPFISESCLIGEAGPTFIASHRPSRGHGRDIIQLGVPIVDPPLEDGTVGNTFKGMFIILYLSC